MSTKCILVGINTNLIKKENALNVNIGKYVNKYRISIKFEYI